MKIPWKRKWKLAKQHVISPLKDGGWSAQYIYIRQLPPKLWTENSFHSQSPCFHITTRPNLSPGWDLLLLHLPNKSFQSSLWLKDTGVIKTFPTMKESTSYTCYQEGCMTSRAVLIVSWAARCTIAATENQPRTTQDDWLGEGWHILAVENLTYKRNDRLRTGRELGCFMKNNGNKDNPNANIELNPLLT